MKTRKDIKIFLFILLTVFVSCEDDFLDKQPLDQLVTGNFYSTSEGLQLAMDACYYPLGDEGFNGKTMWMIGDGASDDAWPNGTDPDYIPIDEFTLSTDNPRNAALWQYLYKMIVLTNLVLTEVDGADADQSLKDRIKGEALFLRAFGHFVLVRLYSDVPLLLRVIPGDEADVIRDPAADVFDAIIDDFKLAIDLLPKKSEYSGDNIGRVNKHAAMGLLAKVYITLAGDLSMYDTNENPDNSSTMRSIYPVNDCYEKCVELCNNIINGDNYKLMDNFDDNYNRNNTNCDESIWQLQFVGCGSTRHGVGNMLQAYWAPYGSGITGAGDGWGTHSPHYDLAACFYPNYDEIVANDYADFVDGNTVLVENPPHDNRFYWTFMFPGVEYPSIMVPNPDNAEEMIPYALNQNYGRSGFAAKKYVIGSGDDVCNQRAPNNTNMLRLPDVQLLKAEALCELGETTDAAPMLDQIRDRAGKPHLDPNLPQAQMRDSIRLERRKELALEQQRWYDILRWGIAYEVLDRQDIYLTPERRLFPIPSTEIAINPNLLQNATY